MKKIAIFGGAFDPITNAHLEIVRKIRDSYDVDILFLPTKNGVWKENMSDINHRINMLKIALHNEDRMDIGYYEANSNSLEKNYTIDTILELIDDYKDYELYYIIGSDQLDKLDKWKDIDNLSNLVKFLVVERDNYPINEDNLIIYNCVNTKIKMDDISSTNIRNYKSNDTKKEVLDYIYENGIYASNLMKELVEEERYQHCLRVADLAYRIAEANDYNPSKAYYAGLIHDCAKRLSHEKAVEYMLKYEPTHIGDAFGLYHQYNGAIIAKELFHVKDKEILHSIKYHTTACLEMSKLDKIVYCADKLEEGREYDSSKLINYCLLDIDYGYAVEFNNNIDYIISKGIKPSDESNMIYKANRDFLNAFELKTIYKAIDDKMGLNIDIYDTRDINTINNYVIVATASSERQLLAIADDIIDIVNKYGFDYHHAELQYKSGWVLIDCCDIIIHIFKGTSREEYDIDDNLKDCKKIIIGG